MKVTSSYSASLTLKVATARYSKRNKVWTFAALNSAIPAETYEDNEETDAKWQDFQVRAIHSMGLKTRAEQKEAAAAAKEAAKAEKEAAKIAKKAEREAKAKEKAEAKAKRDAKKAEKAAIEKEEKKLKPNVTAAVAKLRKEMENGAAATA